jgi:hypothetical protein
MHFIFNKEKATIIIPITEVAIPRSVVEYAEQNDFKLKQEFHLTLLSFQNGKKILAAMQNQFTFDDIVQLAESFKFGVIFNAEYFVLERTIPDFILHGQIQTPKHTRRSIIQKVSVPDFALFFHELKNLTGVSFSNPVEHVTLFTWSDYEPEALNGIALNSEEDFEKYKKEQVY